MSEKLLIINEFGGIRADKVTNYTCVKKDKAKDAMEVRFYFGSNTFHATECDSPEQAKEVIERYKRLIGDTQ